MKAAWFASIRAIVVREAAVSILILCVIAWTLLVPALVSLTSSKICPDLESVLTMASRDNLSIQRCTEADCLSMS